jgi:hypothetical protein
MLWVTGQAPHVDAAASAWLLRRFVDPEARFAFAGDLDDVLTLGGTPFDMPAVELGRRADRCAFESILLKYELGDAALEELAALVHDAELDDGLYATAEAPGLDAVINGLRATHPEPAAFLAAAEPVFEGLYSWFTRLEAE